MRLLASAGTVLAALLGLAFGCGQSEGDSAAPGGAGSATTAGSSSAGASAGKAGASATAGSASSGSASGGASHGGTTAGGGASTTGGQPDAQAGTGSDGGSPDGLVDCDPKKILCKRVAPVCEAGQVPSVEGSCYGNCVKVEACACNAADQCPEPEQYTCWAKQHCGYYVR